LGQATTNTSKRHRRKQRAQVFLTAIKGRQSSGGISGTSNATPGIGIRQSARHQATITDDRETTPPRAHRRKQRAQVFLTAIKGRQSSGGIPGTSNFTPDIGTRQSAWPQATITDDKEMTTPASNQSRTSRKANQQQKQHKFLHFSTKKSQNGREITQQITPPVQAFYSQQEHFLFPCHQAENS
jgi:hypothetical protein